MKKEIKIKNVRKELTKEEDEEDENEWLDKVGENGWSLDNWMN